MTAGRLCNFDGCAGATDVHLTTCGGRHRTSLPYVTVHRSRLLEVSACVTVDGMRVVPKPVALAQIAATKGADASAQALDSVLRGGASIGWIEAVLAPWVSARAAGAAVVMGQLHDRVGRRLPRSWYQRITKRVLASRGVHLVDEYPVDDPRTGRRLAELDLALPELKIGVECQSWEWHSTPAAQARDERRTRRLRLLGWEIVDVWWTDLGRIDEVVEEIQYLIDQRKP